MCLSSISLRSQWPSHHPHSMTTHGLTPRHTASHDTTVRLLLVGADVTTVSPFQNGWSWWRLRLACKICKISSGWFRPNRFLNALSWWLNTLCRGFWGKKTNQQWGLHLPGCAGSRMLGVWRGWLWSPIWWQKLIEVIRAVLSHQFKTNGGHKSLPWETRFIMAPCETTKLLKIASKCLQ